jgi:quercetin dioxygenase-like cupin family protein
MHYSTNANRTTKQTPPQYADHSVGFTRANLLDRDTGSVHMGVGICELTEGAIEPHLHSFEESFYILEGSVIGEIDGRAQLFSPGDYGLISTGVKHAWRNASDKPARWLEMQAPQPRPVDYGRDTFFLGGEVATSAGAPHFTNPAKSLLGHFDESLLPKPGSAAAMEGFNPITGVAIRMFVDRSFGAVHQSLFLIQYNPGAKIDPHDHTFEESYLILSGKVKATADGKEYMLGPGDVIWTSVGCIHSFENVGDEPVRWIETQAPLPPAKEVFRFQRDWEKYK